MTYPFAQAVQWIKRSPQGGGSYHGTSYTEAAPVTVNAVFGPGGSAEVTTGGDTVTTQPALYGVDPSLAVTALDVFVVGGHRFEVDGDPQVFRSPFSGWQPGMVVQLRRVTG